MLEYYHALIKEFSLKKIDEIPLGKQISRKTSGPISDAHLAILHELLLASPEKEELYEWLGIRYAERCEFEDSHFYYRRLRELQAPELNMQDQLMMWRVPVGAMTVEQEKSLEATRANVEKKELRSYDGGGGKDKVREDYSWFGGLTDDTRVVIYRPPLQGWDVEATREETHWGGYH